MERCSCLENGCHCRLDESIIPRRLVLFCLSTLIALVTCSLVINDFVVVLVTEEPEKSMYALTLPLMFLHLFGFYFGVISTVYHTLAKRFALMIMALVMTVINILAFIVRLVFEIACIEFRPEEYSNG